MCCREEIWEVTLHHAQMSRDLGKVLLRIANTPETRCPGLNSMNMHQSLSVYAEQLHAYCILAWYHGTCPLHTQSDADSQNHTCGKAIIFHGREPEALVTWKHLKYIPFFNVIIHYLFLFPQEPKGNPWPDLCLLSSQNAHKTSKTFAHLLMSLQINTYSVLRMTPLLLKSRKLWHVPVL